MHDTTHQQPKKRTSTFLIRLILIMLLLIIGISSAVIYSYTKNLMGNLKSESFSAEEVGIDPNISQQFNRYNNKIKNVLLIGVDSNMNQNMPQRSDSMIILSIDDKNKSIKMSSLMRDTLVNIEGHGKEKLNHAYAYGGVKLLLKTINKNFELNLVDYVLVDFNDLIHVIDAIGGVDLYMTKNEIKYANDNIRNINWLNKTNVAKLELKTQTVRVNGAQALSYARIRYLDSDYKRSERQRTVLVQIYQRLHGVPFANLPGIFMDLSQYAKTNLEQGEIIDMAKKALGSNLPLHGLHFPTNQTSEESTEGNWHLKWDKVDTIKEMHDWIFLDIDPFKKLPLKEINEANDPASSSSSSVPFESSPIQ